LPVRSCQLEKHSMRCQESRSPGVTNVARPSGVPAHERMASRSWRPVLAIAKCCAASAWAAVGGVGPSLVEPGRADWPLELLRSRWQPNAEFGPDLKSVKAAGWIGGAPGSLVALCGVGEGRSMLKCCAGAGKTGFRFVARSTDRFGAAVKVERCLAQENQGVMGLGEASQREFELLRVGPVLHRWTRMRKGKGELRCDSAVSGHS
jgi:hypothetical protein